MKIAICDDERQTAKLFSQKVQMEETGSKISIFSSGNDLIESRVKFDVVFLDIEMEAMNGFQVARILNEIQPQCVFSFITTHSELAVDGYDYQPFRYILKTAPDKVVQRKIKETVQEYYRKNRTLKISYKGKHSIVLVDDIIWIEIQGHCMKIVLVNGEELLWNKTLNEAEKELEKYDFVRCHRSFMVAMRHIKEFNTKRVIMKDGNGIAVGRAYRTHLLEKYQKFLLV